MSAPIDPQAFRLLFSAGLGALIPRLRISEKERFAVMQLYLVKAASFLVPGSAYGEAKQLHGRLTHLATLPVDSIGEPLDVNACLRSVLAIHQGRVPSLATVRRALCANRNCRSKPI